MEIEKNDFFLLSGKMLFVATEFERDTKSLIHSLSLKSKVLSSGTNAKVIEEFCEEILEFKSTKTLLKKIDKPAELQFIFKEAIDARNFIAHELVIDIESLQADEETLNKFIELSIMPNAQKILEAHCIILQLLFQFNKIENTSTHNWRENRLRWLQDLVQ